MELSIIIPVFNVEDYIRPCLESILKQGFDEDCFEIIIVNDGSHDKSIEVISDLIKAHHNIQVIEQENQGVSIARNNGINKASGEYILFIDGDDLLINNSVFFLLEKAIHSKADLVVADSIEMSDEKIDLFSNKTFIQKDGNTQKKTGKELHLQDLNPYYCQVWRAIYRRNFLNQNNLRFIPHIYYEDIPFTHQCYLKANLCLRVNWTFYIYRIGHSSITSSITYKKAIDFCSVISETWKLSKDRNLDDRIVKRLQNDTFIHYSMLIYTLTSCTSIPRLQKMSVLYHLKKNCPDLTFRHSIKQRIVNFLYHRIPFTYMTLRIFYAKYLQDLFWYIGDTIRNKKNRH